MARRRHRGARLIGWLVVVVAMLVAADYGARAYAENLAATQIRKQGFPRKPHVAIAGFPFLTQAIARHFGQVTITSSDIPAGPVTITRMRVIADDVRMNASYNGGTAGPLHGTLFISLGEVSRALSVAGPLAALIASSGGLKIASLGGNEIRGSLSLAGGAVSWSATWKVVTVPPHEVDLRLVAGSGLPGVIRGAVQDIRLSLPALPAGLLLTGGLNASSTGITADVYAASLSFGS
ncbi:MAG: LmeA family phospholipid-binding protein [Streptosporangiaceae bacterium]